MVVVLNQFFCRDLRSNGFEGTIPTFFSTHQPLTGLNVAVNNLTGTIPPFFDMVNVTYLYVHKLSLLTSGPPAVRQFFSGPSPHLRPSTFSLLYSFPSLVNFNRINYQVQSPSSKTWPISNSCTSLNPQPGSMVWLWPLRVMYSNQLSGTLPEFQPLEQLEELYSCSPLPSHFTPTIPPQVPTHESPWIPPISLVWRSVLP